LLEELVGLVRAMAEVVAIPRPDVFSRAASRALAALDLRVVRIVQRPGVIDPVVAAERAARQFQRGDAVEPAVAAVGLPLAVAPDVVGKARARRDLVLESERDVE